jgi:geranylgeranyl reductase family protein
MSYDVIVVGAGPAGSAAAYFNAKQGKRVLLLDKVSFPRDKVCGDGITGKALTLLGEMGLGDELNTIKNISSSGVVIVAPNMKSLSIPIHAPDDPLSAFSIEREVLDNLIFEKAKEAVGNAGGKVSFEAVKEPIIEGSKVVGVKTKEQSYYGSVVIGAGGYNCPISRYVLDLNSVVRQDRNHYSSAIREYWEGISGNSGDFEIHFIDGILPGYFWIFPISETKVNIGVGMLLDDMDNQSIKLKEMLSYIINESYLSDRFKNATKIENSRKGWLLPLGSPRGANYPPRKNFAEGCILVGDAASLIDPFTGEGIGNALMSGKLTANYTHINEETGSDYQQQLWALIGSELTNSHRLQQMLKRKWLINWFIRKATKKPKLQMILTDMLHNKDTQGSFNSKWFLLKSLLF